jgi:hypothetical protein
MQARVSDDAACVSPGLRCSLQGRPRHLLTEDSMSSCVGSRPHPFQPAPEPVQKHATD